jgi:hypothetical protein
VHLLETFIRNLIEDARYRKPQVYWILCEKLKIMSTVRVKFTNGTFHFKLGTGLCHIAYFDTLVTEDQFLKNVKYNIRKHHKMYL